MLAVAGPYRAWKVGMETTDLASILSEEETTVETPEVEAQAETPEPTEPEPTGETAAPPAEPKDDPIDTHRKGLEAAVLAERRKRQELEQQLARFTQQQQPVKQDGPPDPNAYQENPQEYWRLLARYEARQELQEVVRQAQEQQTQQMQARQAQEVASRIDALVAAGNAKYRDFDSVINAGLGPFLNPSLKEAIADSEAGADVSYWLGKNPGEAARISQLPEKAMVREITKLESRVRAPVRQTIPQTLTQTRDSRGQFQPAYDGPTPLDAVLNRNQG